MTIFLSTAGHAAVAYLHFLIAWRFFHRRKEDYFAHLFWYLIVLSVLLHIVYAGYHIAIATDQSRIAHLLTMAGYHLLIFYPALVSSLFLGELTQMPQKSHLPARVFSVVSSNTKRLIVICMAIAVLCAVVSAYRQAQLSPTFSLFDGLYNFGNLYALWYMVTFSILWLIMIAAGLRAPKKHNSSSSGYVFVISLSVALSLLSYFVANEFSWSIIPIFATTGLSLSFCWYRFRTQFMDVILSKLWHITALITAVVTINWVSAHPSLNWVHPDLQMLLLLCLIVVLAVTFNWISDAFELWLYPTSQYLSTMQSELPDLLNSCTNPNQAIESTEAYLSRLFNTQVAINREIDEWVEVVEIKGAPQVRIRLNYMRKWMPWFSEALAIVTTAGNYLQSHLTILQTLQREHEEHLKTEQLASLAAKAELIAMRAQIRPHFLFNCLNSIHGFVTTNPPMAEHMIEKLSDLLRGVLNLSDADEISLAKELELVEKYIAIEKVRYGDHLSFYCHVDQVCEAESVPAFSIQPLVENAIKYAVDSQLEPVSISVTAKKLKGNLVIEVEDNGPGIQNGTNKGLGIAMQNIESRLKNLYGSGGALSLENAQSKGAVARLVIPLSYPKLVKQN